MERKSEAHRPRMPDEEQSTPRDDSQIPIQQSGQSSAGERHHADQDQHPTSVQLSQPSELFQPLQAAHHSQVQYDHARTRENFEPPRSEHSTEDKSKNSKRYYDPGPNPSFGTGHSNQPLIEISNHPSEVENRSQFPHRVSDAQERRKFLRTGHPTHLQRGRSQSSTVEYPAPFQSQIFNQHHGRGSPSFGARNSNQAQSSNHPQWPSSRFLYSEVINNTQFAHRLQSLRSYINAEYRRLFFMTGDPYYLKFLIPNESLRPRGHSQSSGIAFPAPFQYHRGENPSFEACHSNQPQHSNHPYRPGAQSSSSAVEDHTQFLHQVSDAQERRQIFSTTVPTYFKRQNPNESLGPWGHLQSSVVALPAPFQYHRGGSPSFGARHSNQPQRSNHPYWPGSQSSTSAVDDCTRFPHQVSDAQERRQIFSTGSQNPYESHWPSERSQSSVIENPASFQHQIVDQYHGRGISSFEARNSNQPQIVSSNHSLWPVTSIEHPRAPSPVKLQAPQVGQPHHSRVIGCSTSQTSSEEQSSRSEGIPVPVSIASSSLESARSVLAEEAPPRTILPSNISQLPQPSIRSPVPLPLPELSSEHPSAPRPVQLQAPQGEQPHHSRVLEPPSLLPSGGDDNFQSGPLPLSYDEGPHHSLHNESSSRNLCSPLSISPPSHELLIPEQHYVDNSIPLFREWSAEELDNLLENIMPNHEQPTLSPLNSRPHTSIESLTTEDGSESTPRSRQSPNHEPPTLSPLNSCPHISIESSTTDDGLESSSEGSTQSPNHEQPVLSPHNSRPHTSIESLTTDDGSGSTPSMASLRVSDSSRDADEEQ